MSNRKNLERGCCPGHPSKKVEEGKKHCVLCTKQAKKRAVARVLQAKLAGVCYKHKDRKVAQGSVRCCECLLSIRLWNLGRAGLSEEELKKAEEAFKAHDGRCWGCASSNPGVRGWCIDHDHKTKKFRGILCTRCNVALGMVQDNPLLLRALIKYLDFSERV